MKRTYKRFFSGLLVLCMAVSMCAGFASAAFVTPDDQQSSAYLDAYGGGLAFTGNGKVGVSINVTAVVNATMLGAKDVYMYESTDGVHFTQVAHYNYQDYPKMVSTGYYYSKDILEYQGISGRYYTADIYFYAGNASGGDTRLLSMPVIP